ncbi:alpha-N-arabinofuranosidase [Pseudooceanicola sediminis]|uniref:non-reducing end alpha-L-arabinofuranosidase n=1 Tax=Pseudooceanicola sediminis TaxID=2211117 RepID=A0A399IVD3_9RHOB|nr:alpha-N-arabinofuranosidase [Pseudooceanicola sediminis]RII36900.1 alpha-N-arabinofuranosidase [Pseudooceanicola sediminis]|tara:strand:- start:75712 stop:77217 length:1506 start_codon:yes stop_codon:yes gene_type:complete
MRVSAAIHRDFTIAAIDDRLYAAFIEHMGRAIYSGIYEPGHPQADEHGFRRDVADMVRDLNIPAIRYPGGNFVSAYNWEDGIGPKEDRPVRLDLAWRSKESNQVGINDFAVWARDLGIDMMLAVNLGSRGIEEARNFMEYVNHPSGTHWSDLRRSHGVEQPYNVKMWCLGNEMDGPWQIGHKKASDYGHLANETAKALRQLTPDAEMIVCGSSNDEMPTYPEWERQVLEECYENVDYISLHKYFGNSSRDTLNFFGKVEETGRYIQAIGGVIDFVKAKKRATNDVYICFDEWNVWYHKREEDSKNWKSWDWPEAPALLEEDYTFEDALFIGCLLNEFIRRSDRVKIACIAQLVNVIAPIRAEADGPAWRQSIYWPYQMASLYGRGTALSVAVDGPTYDCAVASDVPYIDIAAVHDRTAGAVTVFIVNRHLSEAADLRTTLTGFPDATIDFHQVIEGHDLMASNGPGAEIIAPTKGSGIAVDDGVLTGSVAPLSYHVVRLKV